MNKRKRAKRIKFRRWQTGKYGQMNKKNGVVINHFGTGYARYTHSHIMKQKTPAKCLTCKEIQTEKYTLAITEMTSVKTLT